jgi:RimJ/RimL family protein N-acetyltransferase
MSVSTERFVLRTVTQADASDRWCGWSGDPEIMDPLNVPTRRMSREELVRYIARADGENTLLIGVFTRAMSQQIGFYLIEVNRMHMTANFNLVIGDRQYWGKNVVNETRAALLDELFERRGIEKAYGMPLARNFPAVFNYKAQGWRLEGLLRGQCRSVKDGTRLDQYQFGMLREEWRARRSATR